MLTGALPLDVEILPLLKHRDARGWLSEVFRKDGVAHDPCQWNVTASEPNVLRGMHVHVRHRDYLVVLQGRMSVGLFDIRSPSPTYHDAAMVTLASDQLSALQVPVGVMHGFYVHEPTIFLYGVDAYYDPSDELGCHWADPGMALPWPCTAPVLSERDRRAGRLNHVEAQYRARRQSLEFERPTARGVGQRSGRLPRVGTPHPTRPAVDRG